MTVVGSSEVAGWCWGWLRPSCLRGWASRGLVLQKSPQQSVSLRWQATVFRKGDLIPRLNLWGSQWAQDSVRQNPCQTIVFFWRAFLLAMFRWQLVIKELSMAWWPHYGMACVFLYRWWCFLLYFFSNFPLKSSRSCICSFVFLKSLAFIIESELFSQLQPLLILLYKLLKYKPHEGIIFYRPSSLLPFKILKTFKSLCTFG